MRKLSRDDLKEILHAIDSACKHVRRVVQTVGNVNEMDDVHYDLFLAQRTGILVSLQEDADTVRKLLNGDI